MCAAPSMTFIDLGQIHNFPISHHLIPTHPPFPLFQNLTLGTHPPQPTSPSPYIPLSLSLCGFPSDLADFMLIEMTPNNLIRTCLAAFSFHFQNLCSACWAQNLVYHTSYVPIPGNYCRDFQTAMKEAQPGDCGCTKWSKKHLIPQEMQRTTQNFRECFFRFLNALLWCLLCSFLFFIFSCVFRTSGGTQGIYKSKAY